MISEFIAGMLGTMAFSILFGVPSRYYVYCGLIGSGGWIIYSAAVKVLGPAEASLLATMAVIFFSRLVAVWKRCPVTIFLIAGIFPLVPGSGIYWTTYYLVTDQLPLALHTGYQAVKCAMAIVLGIVLIFELPQSLFARLLRQKNR